jgi:hypothetical protein
MPKQPIRNPGSGSGGSDWAGINAGGASKGNTRGASALPKVGKKAKPNPPKTRRATPVPGYKYVVKVNAVKPAKKATFRDANGKLVSKRGGQRTKADRLQNKISGGAANPRRIGDGPKPARRVDINGKRITRKGKLVSSNATRKAKSKSVTVMFTPTRAMALDIGMSNKLSNAQMRKKAGSTWNMAMAKKPASFKQARKAMDQDRVRYNTAEKKINKTEKVLGHPSMWNFKPSLYNKKGALTNAKTRSFPKKSAPVKPSSLRMNKKGKK